jgi:hypothetical protein
LTFAHKRVLSRRVQPFVGGKCAMRRVEARASRVLPRRARRAARTAYDRTLSALTLNPGEAKHALP